MSLLTGILKKTAVPAACLVVGLVGGIIATKCHVGIPKVGRL